MRTLALTAQISLLFAASAAADPIVEEPYAPFKLVAVMPDTGQVLVWDENATEYRLAKGGDDLDGWRVSGLDLKDARGPRMALQKEDLIDELELVRTPRPGAVIFKDRGPEQSPVAATTPRPVSRITPTVISSTQPAPPAQMREPAPPQARETAPAPELEPESAPPPPPPTSAPALMLEETRVLNRADFDREINDFDRLMAGVQVDAASGGGFVLLKLDPRSWLASLGFQEGDVVRQIAGERVSRVEDAARVYARLRNLASFSAEIQRGGTWIHLRIELTDGGPDPRYVRPGR